ncbi:unnamed protein product [Anisakis simplex]|uniref:Uncharacterized protein n=1 Tax=Anisakis simplex TaxID=6269 RepID=A0A3P6NRZ9_ANISI|nr:unnamed protein product [Anisakis simplex]
MMKGFYRAAGQILFSSEALWDVIHLLSRILKFSFVLFQETQTILLNNPLFRRKALLLEKISSTVLLISGADHYNVDGKLCKESMRIASKAIVCDMTQKVYKNLSQHSLLNTLKEKKDDLRKWATRLSLLQELNVLDIEINATMEKCVVDILTKQCAYDVAYDGDIISTSNDCYLTSIP